MHRGSYTFIEMLVVCVIVLLVFISLLQSIGNALARRTTNHALFHKRIK